MQVRRPKPGNTLTYRGEVVEVLGTLSLDDVRYDVWIVGADGQSRKVTFAEWVRGLENGQIARAE